MLIPPQLRPGVVAPPRPSHARIIRYRLRGFILLLRVLLLCFQTAAHADKALPTAPAPNAAPGFLEAVAVDYANSQVFNAVEGIAAVREPRAVRSGPSPAPSAPASNPSTVTPAPANIRRVNAQ